MKNLAALALNAAEAAGAQYADARVIETDEESLSTKNGVVGEIESSEDIGIGIRVIAQGAWGFAATDDLTSDGIVKAAQHAVEIARAGAQVNEHDVALAPEEIHTADWQTPVSIDPFTVPLSQKIDLLLKIDAALRGQKGVNVAEAHMTFRRNKKVFASTDGSQIAQTLYLSGIGYNATATRDGELQIRSYPSSHRGLFQTKGYELVDELPLLDEAPRIAEEAVALLDAPQCPSKTTDLILLSDQLSLQLHESCGHPIELDRVLGAEANYAGTSFLTPEKRANLKYGSDIVNIVADATPEHGPGAGTFAYDDEGVPAQRRDIVRDGLFVGYLTSRETAHVVSDSRSGAAMRAEGWWALPLIRMTNVSLLPGEWDYDSLIADTDDGIVMCTNRSWSIDDRRENFQFGTEIGWEVKNGKLGRMLKNPTYQGMTAEFWNSCDAICNEKHWMLWGLANCGKGEPPQAIATGHGVAPARFRNVKVGVAYD